MNRDTHPEIANITTCGKFRQPQDRQKEATTRLETYKEVDRTPREDTSYFVSIKDPRDAPDRGTEDKNSVLRSPPSMVNPRLLPSNRDPRRNLYVLGLPFDLTKPEFARMFEPYGTVTHAVILATLDSASRRRGFVVMSSHQEARTAMETLSRTQTRGHTLDVSWAVVQRSQGFLDGADRSMMLAVSSPSISEHDGPFPIPGGSADQTNNHWELTHVPTSKLMVSKLSTILFTQVADLHPLFYPFGPIKDIKILGSSHVSPPDTTITAIVEYLNASNAQEAKEALQRQSYAGHTIEAYYVCNAGPPIHTRLSPFLSGSPFGNGKSSDIGLNPFAIPFNIGSRFSMGNQIHNSRYSTATPSGLPSDAPLAPQPFSADLRPYMTDTISRSSSATSSTWSHDSRPLRPSRASHLSLSHRANTYASYA